MNARRFLSLAPALAILLFVAVLQGAAYWPGLMTWDAVRQYDQAIDGVFDDWHPPAMEWLWRQLTALHAGPAPMLLLQLSLYWGGFAMLLGWAAQRRRTGLTIAIAACALMPITLALMGAVLKDCLMAGALLAATGLLAIGEGRLRSAARAIAVLLILATATLRFNAFLAGVPLLIALAPAAWRSTRLRLAGSTVLAAAALILAMPVANHLLGAKRSGVELSLIIFDLAGITEHSGVDAFPPLAVRDPVAVNHLCYTPVRWDTFAWWVDRPCPIGFEQVRTAFAAPGRSASRHWLSQILAHPIAYAEHRLRHFSINSRFLVADEIERPVQTQSAPSPGNYTIENGPVQTVIDRAAVASAATPLGWPIWWMALAAGVLTVAPLLPSRRIILPLAGSALLYGGGYLFLSVASELRYHLWTTLGAAIAAVIAADDLAAGARVPRRRLILAARLVILVTILCSAWRLA